MVEKIGLTFLGTGSSIPTARRNHPAILLRFKGENILIDCGEGTQRQFRKAKLNLCKVTKILISHWHGDHILGLPGLLQTLNLNGRNGELIIYGPKGSKKKFQEMVAPYLGFYWNISRKMGNKFDIIVKEVGEGIVFDGDDFFIEAAGVDHDCSALAYSFAVKEKVRLNKAKLAKLGVPNSLLIRELAKGRIVEIGGKKIDGKKLVYREKGRRVVFVADTRYSENVVKFAKGADVLVSEATYAKEEQDVAEEYGHLTSVDAAKIAKKAKVGALVLTHLSQRYDAVPKIILNEAKAVFGKVKIVEDFDEVEL
jgi:ribonuclease Z